MKKIIYILTLLGLFLLPGCGSQSDSTTEFVLMCDITDTLHAGQIEPTEVTAIFDQEKNKWRGAKFRGLILSDISLNPEEEVFITAENEWSGNELERKKKQSDFTLKVVRSVERINEQKPGRKTSSIFLPVAKELNRLAQSKSEKKIIAIQSDLMENTDAISFYSPRTFSALKRNPDSLAKQLETRLELENLDGIFVNLIYHPLNPKEDEQYRVVSTFYKNWFESKGAKVEISASLKIGDEQ